jgi:hypothetical protein
MDTKKQINHQRSSVRYVLVMKGTESRTNGNKVVEKFAAQILY